MLESWTRSREFALPSSFPGALLERVSILTAKEITFSRMVGISRPANSSLIRSAKSCQKAAVSASLFQESCYGAELNSLLSNSEVVLTKAKKCTCSGGHTSWLIKNHFKESEKCCDIIGYCINLLPQRRGLYQSLSRKQRNHDLGPTRKKILRLYLKVNVTLVNKPMAGLRIYRELQLGQKMKRNGLRYGGCLRQV